MRGKANGGPSREQEVLHYQWFADMGNVDAQRMLGKILAQGSEPHDMRRALRYFRCAIAVMLTAGCEMAWRLTPLQAPQRMGNGSAVQHCSKCCLSFCEPAA